MKRGIEDKNFEKSCKSVFFNSAQGRGVYNKIKPIFWSLLACFVLACTGITITLVNPFSLPVQEEPSEAQYTVTFKHISNSSYSSYFNVSFHNTSVSSELGVYGGTSFSRDLSSGTWVRIVIPSTATTNRWVYAYGINGDSSTYRGVNELWFRITSACTVSFGVESGTCWPFQTYDANGGNFELSNTSRNLNTVACYLNGRYYRKNTAEYSLIGWRQNENGWMGPLFVGKSATSVQSNTTGDYTSTSTDYATLQYDSDGNGVNETWYYSNGTPDYNYHTDNVSYSGGRSFLSLWWASNVIRNISLGVTTDSSWTPNQASAQVFLETYKTYSNIMYNTYYFPYADPTREHYMFAGWYTSPTGGTRVTEGTTCSQNTTLYAHWTPNEYVVELEWPDEYTSETVTAGGTYIMPDGINSEYYSHTGYHIEYWEDDYSNTYVPGETYSVIDLADSVGAYYDSDTICLYAHEAPNVYTFKFKDLGGTVTISSQTRTYGETVTLLSSSGFSKTGYTLSGWKNEDGTLFSKGATYSVSDLAGLEVNTNGATITLYAQWTINTYTLSFLKGYYYSSSGYSVSLTAPGCTITNATLTESNPRSAVSHTYSTTPITVTITCNDAYLWIYIDGEYFAGDANSCSYSWTPNANHTFTWYLRERKAVSANVSEGVESAKFSNIDWQWGEQNVSTTTSFLQGYRAQFVATLKTGYVFHGWYNGSTRVSTELTYTQTINSDLTLTAKATKIYNMVQYDSTNKYFYFEDGYFPQTYVGDSMNSTLTSWYSSSSPSAGKSMYVNNRLTYGYHYNSTCYVRVYCPTTYTVKLKSGSSKTFSAGSYYWFNYEPIRWRVSECGVSIDYYSNTLYDRFVADGGVIGVSQYVLDYDFMAYSYQMELSDRYLDMNLHANITYNNSHGDYPTSRVSMNKTFDYIGNGASNTKIGKETIAYSGIVQVSLGEMEHIGLTDLEAPVTDLTAMLSGTNYGKNLKYSTRDLYDNQNSRCVTEFGIVKNRWLDGLCGIRYSFASSGKK